MVDAFAQVWPELLEEHTKIKEPKRKFVREDADDIPSSPLSQDDLDNDPNYIPTSSPLGSEIDIPTEENERYALSCKRYITNVGDFDQQANQSELIKICVINI